MTNRYTRIIAKIPLSTEEILYNDHKFIEVLLTYNIGGMNFFQGVHEARGYYLSVTPIEEAKGWRTVRGFSGVKQLVKEAARFSAGVLASLQPDPELMKKLVNHVIEKNKIVLPKEIS